MKTFTSTFLISLMWYEQQIRMKALWSSDFRVQVGINNVVNRSTLYGSGDSWEKISKVVGENKTQKKP